MNITHVALENNILNPNVCKAMKDLKISHKMYK